MSCTKPDNLQNYSQMENGKLNREKEKQVQKRRKRAPKVYKNQQDLELDFLETALVRQQLWKENWLDGYQYYMLLKNQHRLDQKQFPIMSTHPTWIYEKPINGHLYFLQDIDLEKDGPFKLGFPRTSSLNKKSWKWKRNNFPTKLPKNDPKIVYICATTEGIELDDEGNPHQKRFRMHIAKMIDLYNKEQQNESNSKGLVVCQMLEIEFGKTKEGKKYIPKPISQIRKRISPNKSRSINDNNKCISIIENNTYTDSPQIPSEMNLEEDLDQFNNPLIPNCHKSLIHNEQILIIEENYQEENQNGSYQSLKQINQQDHTSYTTEQCTTISNLQDQLINKITPEKQNLYFTDPFKLQQQVSEQIFQEIPNHKWIFQSFEKQNLNNSQIYLKNTSSSYYDKYQCSSMKKLQYAKKLKNIKKSKKQSDSQCLKESFRKQKWNNLSKNYRKSHLQKKLFHNQDNSLNSQQFDILSHSNQCNSPQIAQDHYLTNNYLFSSQYSNSNNNNNINTNFNSYYPSKLINDSQFKNQLEIISSYQNLDSRHSPIKKIGSSQKKREICLSDQFKDGYCHDNYFCDDNYFAGFLNQMDKIDKQDDHFTEKNRNILNTNSNQQSPLSIQKRFSIQPVVFRQSKKNKDEYYAIFDLNHM